ncbi:RraA family protein [Bosea rubneri]|uniref:Putative 4-hydroxy-4-methyl-2-oxoglutarate aldolase n=1 Tax=Bosea rubneri TaxID=3075434 RepID=A0ABU3SDM0_9HYPH|nr:hypothetical protein [Bosea sp. ZW T0_25]MDU0342869.1 hypothetical protein [Bosea sp. ZW T0_25]
MAEDKLMATIATPVLSNAVERLEGPWSPGAHALRGMAPLRRGDAVRGPAYTIRLRRAAKPAAANVEVLLRAYDDAPAGSVVVVEVVDDVGGAVLGDIIAHRLKAIRVAGVVVAGPVRDLIGLEEFGPPIWYAQATMLGLEMAETATEAQVELSVGGTRVAPGDLVFADIDGAFVVPKATMGALAPIAAGVIAREEQWHRSLAAGRSLLETLRTPAS